MKKPNASITASDKRKLCAGVAAIRDRFKLSYTDLSNICGGLANGFSKSTAENICTGKISLDHATRVKPIVIEALQDFLRRKGFSTTEIANQLKQISTGEEFKNMIVSKTALTPIAQEFFGLNRDPFDASKSDPRDISQAFTSPALDRIADSLEDAIHYQGFKALVGAVGSGKTQMKKRIVERANRSNGRVRLMFPDFTEMKRVNSGAVVSFVLEAFDRKPRRNLVQAHEQLRQMLGHLNEQDTRVALVFDEAHRLNDDQMSALKNFWELGSGGFDRFLGVILFGQPLLKSRLDDYKFREIAERVEILDMPVMTAKYAMAYLTHRFQLAGGDVDKLIERKAIELIAAQAETPLALGNLVNAALMKAFHLNDKKVVAALIKDSTEPAVRSVRRAS